jgi:two-component system, OmpR family, phosphate regulon sensor histidine kinase PhoR
MNQEATMKAKPKLYALESDEFLSLVTHEIRNPLTSINGFTDFAKDAVKNHDDQSALGCLEVVRAEAQRVLRLAEDLLDLTQVRAGKFSVHLETIDLAEIVMEIAGRYEAITHRRITVEASDDFPTIAGDSVRLGQVIVNLVSNATKYSPEDMPIRITMSAGDESVIVRVWNGGSAIPAEKIPQMFKRFSRLGNGHGNGNGKGEHIKGTGLGLFISKEIVEMHCGRIEMQSSEGEGTAFIIELPRGRPDVEN